MRMALLRFDAKGIPKRRPYRIASTVFFAYMREEKVMGTLKKVESHANVHHLCTLLQVWYRRSSMFPLFCDDNKVFGMGVFTVLYNMGDTKYGKVAVKDLKCIRVAALGSK